MVFLDLFILGLVPLVPVDDSSRALVDWVLRGRRGPGERRRGRSRPLMARGLVWSGWSWLLLLLTLIHPRVSLAHSIGIGDGVGTLARVVWDYRGAGLLLRVGANGAVLVWIWPCE